jgi:Ca2+-binding RTX toxin-like protein
MDTLAGGGGNDTLWGGADADTFIFRETGTANADSIGDWTSGQDTLLLDAAVMTALGASGDFTATDARFWASSTGAAHDADDRIIYNSTTRQLFYDADGNGSGAAQLIATLQTGATLVATDISVEGGSGGQVINGTSGDDLLIGTPAGDTINGLGGNDTINGGEGSDLMDGGSGNDRLVASANDNDTLIGGDGNDTLDGATHSEGGGIPPAVETMDGGLGDDLYIVDRAADFLTDAGGVDTVRADNISWTLGAGFENLVIANGETESFALGAGNELDNFIEGDYTVRLEGRDGNDTLVGGGWEDTLLGGEGNDSLLGFDLSDQLFGDAGDDTLNGSIDRDTLTGGTGADTFVLEDSTDQDLITDFQFGADILLIDGRYTFDEIGRSGDFLPGDARFASNSTGTAQDASDRLIYNNTTGELWYDADGTGATEGWVVAVLQGAPTLTASSIEVINGDTGGTDGDDHLVGTSGPDTITGLDGNDTLEGLAGDDLLEGGDDADLIVGGEGNDTLRSDGNGSLPEEDDAPDTLDGGLGDDVYWVDYFDTTLPDPGGIDTVVAVLTDWTLGPGLENLDLWDDVGTALDGTGNELDNIIWGATEGGTLRGMGGNDLLISRNVHDGGALEGGDGNDTLHGGEDGRLNGGAGNDILNGSGVFEFSVSPGAANADRLGDFDSGFDTIRLDGNAHVNAGQSGFFTDGDSRFAANSSGTAQDASDRVIYNTTTGELWYDVDGSGAGARQLIATLEGAPTLVATDIEIVNGSVQGQVINGTSGADTLADTAGNDTINGLAGNDTINGGHGGNDVVNGGDGRDTLAFMTATNAVVANFVTGTVTGGGSGTTSFTNIERVITGDFNDMLTGNASAQNLTARAGADTLAGAGGVDTLWGGAGADTFIFRETGTANADTIGDWSSGSDEIALDNAAMSALGADGAFVAGDARFWASSTGTAHDANDRVLFNTGTGQLYYDADGNGSGAAQLIATVQAGATVVATDISVI